MFALQSFRFTDLAGTDVFEQSRVDELSDLFIDLHAAVRPFLHVAGGIEEGDQVGWLHNTL